MNPVIRRVLIGVIFLVVLGALLWPKLKPAEEPVAFGSSSGQDTRLTVNAVTVETESIRDRILTTGIVLPNEIVDLTAETSGKVVEMYIDEGRSVNKGDLLLKLNDSELQAQLKTAELRLELARDVERRQKALLDKEGLSQAEYDVVANELSVQLSTVELIKAQIDKTELRAPFSGVIGLRYISEGSYVTNSSRIATLQEINPIKIEFSIPERHASRVKIGDAIFFTVEGYDATHRGLIYAFEPLIQQDTRSLRLRARSANPGTQLLPGSFASIELVFEEIKNAIAVPSVALIPELGGTKIYTYSGGVIVPKQVTTGIRLQDRVQILSGLTPADTVITSGIQQVFPGMPVLIALEAGI